MIGSPPFLKQPFNVFWRLAGKCGLGLMRNTCSCTCLRNPQPFYTSILYTVERVDDKGETTRPKENLRTGHHVSGFSGTRQGQITLIGSSPARVLHHHPLLRLSPDGHLRSSPLRPLNSLGTPDLCIVISICLGRSAIQLTFRLM
jgi:hypothetical protein